MTSQKNLKRRVRSRMEKTGERYSAARRQLLSGPPDREPAGEPAREPINPHRFSDESVRRSTGRGWEEWFALLDAWDAIQRSHGEIAGWLVSEHEMAGWWAQSVTVAYEQARGMRQPGQVAGGFSVGVSRTIDAPLARLFEAFVDEDLRGRWLPEGLEIRTATRGRSLRANWDDGRTRVNVGFAARGEARSQAQLQHERLPDAETAERMKAFWRERMDTLRSLLEDR